MTLLEFFSDRSRWCQQAFARDKNGRNVPSRDENACQWCLLGAINHLLDDEKSIQARMKLYSVLDKYSCDSSLIIFNDTHTYEEVMSLIEKANV